MKLLRIAALTLGVLGVAAVASANTIWNFDNVVFQIPNNGPSNTITGWFELIGTGTNVVTGIGAFDFTIAGSNAQANHHYVSATDGQHLYSAHNVSFNALGFSLFADFLFPSDLTNAGGTVNLVGGPPVFDVGSYVCPGCGVLVSGSLTTLDVNGTAVSAVPEPATLVLCGIGAMFIAGRLRRRQ